MITNTEVQKHNNENDMNLIRRFSRKIRSLGIVRTTKKSRYFKREESLLRRKRSALAKLETGKKYDRLRKLGKIT